jgi:ketosteroid isomerase-like protein
VLKFEQFINSRSPDAICGLLTEDSAFIDSLGNRMAGLESLRKAWAGYFKMVPDYAVSHTEIFLNGDTVAMFGSAHGHVFEGRQNKEGRNYAWAYEMQVEDLDGSVLRLGSEPKENEPIGEWLDMHGCRWNVVNGEWISTKEP